ncbi:unnamed protein product [Lymnaea stagnalis]|uniref:G-protein coupled receptors family 1 profile domain-containing protein n=1 Tax=Lymnaea stagnalis TaxID=6523 RepID=A0AAV2HU83_LYMST
MDGEAILLPAANISKEDDVIGEIPTTFFVTIFTYKSDDPLISFSNKLFEYYLLALIGVGIPGNLLTAITLQTILPLSVSSLLVSVVALFDSLALIAKVIENQLLLYDVELNTFACNALTMFSVYLSTVANWSLVLLCMEQYIAVAYPLKKELMLTKSRSCIVSIIVCLAMFIGFVVAYFLNSDWLIDALPCWMRTAKTLQSYLIIENLHVFAPYILVFGLAVCIYVGHASFLKKHNKIEQENRVVESETGLASSSKEVAEVDKISFEEKMTLVTLTKIASGLFLVLVLPYFAYVIITLVSSVYSIYFINTTDWMLFTHIRSVLLDTTYAIKFLLYCVSGTFRKHFRHRILWC